MGKRRYKKVSKKQRREIKEIKDEGRTVSGAHIRHRQKLERMKQREKEEEIRDNIQGALDFRNLGFY